MKKILALALVLVMIFSLAACTKKNDVNPDNGDNGVVDNGGADNGNNDVADNGGEDNNGSDADVDSGDNADVNTGDNGSEGGAEDSVSFASALLADFREIIKDGDKTPEEIANELITNPMIQFAPIVMPVEPGYLNGFSNEISGFESGAIFAPMIGSIPFVGYVFNVEEDVDGFVQQLKDNADLRWNICTQADEMVCEAEGNTVFFVMAPLSAQG